MAGGTDSVGALRSRPLVRAAALAGAASFVATVAGITVGDVSGREVGADLPPGLLTGRLQEHLGEVRSGAALLALGAVLTVVFLGAVWIQFRQAAEWLAVVAVAAGVLLASQILGLADRGITLAGLADLNEDGTARALLATGSDAVRRLAAPAFLLSAAAAVAGFGYGLFPRWFRWGSAVVAVALAVVVAPLDAHPLLALLGGLWVLTASLLFGLGDLVPTEDDLSAS